MTSIKLTKGVVKEMLNEQIKKKLNAGNPFQFGISNTGVGDYVNTMKTNFSI